MMFGGSAAGSSRSVSKTPIVFFHFDHFGIRGDEVKF